MSRVRNRESHHEVEKICYTDNSSFPFVLQSYHPMYDLPNFHLLFPLSVLGSLFRLQGCRERPWEYRDCPCSLRESLRASKDTGVSWLADSLSITATKPTCLGHRDTVSHPDNRSAQIWTACLSCWRHLLAFLYFTDASLYLSHIQTYATVWLMQVTLSQIAVFFNC